MPSHLPGFAEIVDGPLRIWVRAGYEAHARTLAGEGAGGGETVAGGRGAHPVVTLPGGERVVVRRYLRGGLVRHLVRARYFGGHRAWAELHATERAAGAGVRVPTVLAAAERRAGVGYTATLATRWIPGARELAGWLPGADAQARREVLEEAGRQVGRMHTGGVAHPDLNLRNFLVSADAEVHLLDFDRARLFGGPVPAARRARDLRRFARAARKLAAPLTAELWDAFRAGYGAGWPPGLRLP